MTRSRWWVRSFVAAALLAAALALAAVAGAATGSKHSAKVAKDQFVWILPVLPQSIDPAAYEGQFDGRPRNTAHQQSTHRQLDGTWYLLG